MLWKLVGKLPRDCCLSVKVTEHIVDYNIMGFLEGLDYIEAVRILACL